ncbi:MAG: pyrroline-5-carboxylate reductase [Hyphomicrobiaceae bacterium]|nr:pyrroline-5-carboxylate reductase [Hyphomicrobiaceae bacterium]
MTLELDGPLVLAGAGKMGGALLAGWLTGGLDPSMVVVQDPSPSPETAELLRRHGIRCVASLAPLERSPAVILAAVKPQAMDTVFPPLAKMVGPDTLILSIAAGRPLASFEAYLAAPGPVIRAMPNTPAAIGRGITVCVGNAAAGDRHRAIAGQLLAAVGDVAWIGDEAQMDAVTAVSGSGPAYVFLLAEALTDAGVRQGLPPELAAELARATVAGAGELMRRSSDSAARLRENVTSPGGTTAAALGVLMREPGGLRDLLAEAVAAATKRGRELSG